MTPAEGTVVLVEDDEAVRRALSRLLKAAGYDVISFDSADAFLEAGSPAGPVCLVLDVRLPGLSGLDLQERLEDSDLPTSIVFITGHGDLPMGVRAMKKGAVDFLTKPVDEVQLIAAIEQGISRDREERGAHEELAELRERVARLTPREHEVFSLVVTGMLNRQIAQQLGAAKNTIKVHRARVMRKMEADSVADLVRFADRLGVSPPPYDAQQPRP